MSVGEYDDVCRGCGRYVKGCAGECDKCFPVQCNATGDYITKSFANTKGRMAELCMYHVYVKPGISHLSVIGYTAGRSPCSKRMTREQLSEMVRFKLAGDLAGRS